MSTTEVRTLTDRHARPAPAPRPVGRAVEAPAPLRQAFARYRQTGDRALRNELVEQHRPLAEVVARRYSGRGEPLDDLDQVALLGLMKAVERFDPDLGYQFDAFASVTIHGELKRHFRDRTWRVVVPRRAKERSLQVAAAVEALSQQLGRAPTITEIAAELGCGEDDVLEAIEIGATNRPVHADLGGPDFQIGPMSQHASVVEPGYEAFDDGDLVRDLMRAISDRERVICELRFVDELVQREIAERLGISQMQVSRVLTRSIERMRRRAERSRA
jgi:RNA polymerase sigma-B factor